MELFGEVLRRYQPDFCVAYGSLVSKQTGHQGKAMVDFIFGVSSPAEWHEHNLSTRAADYSLVGRLIGAKGVLHLQRKPAGVYYNSFVPVDGHLIKYGVIGLSELVQDLTEWTHLYTAGRLQKPVVVVKDEPSVHAAMASNLDAAVNVALLTLPERFIERDFYNAICGLSYIGDSRMRFGENSRKVQNIVDGNYTGFQALYLPRLLAHPCVKLQDMFVQNQLAMHHDYIGKVPRNVRGGNYEADEIKAAIARIVNASSRSQTLKGFISTGPINSIRYALQKVKKRVWPLAGTKTAVGQNNGA